MSGGSLPDPWWALRRFTPARLALGRAGDSLPTEAVLDFALAHARARDAVHTLLDRDDLGRQLEAAGFDWTATRSAARDRAEYLLRPDLGRRLDADSRSRLANLAGGPEAVFVLADGLSAAAVQAHAVPLLVEARACLASWRLGRVVVAEQARVALGDEIGALLGAAQVVVLIGERPGLTAPDSLGAYLTYAPRPGRRDAERNCISNIRPAGLAYVDAARKLCALMRAARTLRASGLALREDALPAEEPPALPED